MKNKNFGYSISSLEKLKSDFAGSSASEKAFEELSLKGFPTPRVEDWKYTDLKRVSSQEYAHADSIGQSIDKKLLNSTLAGLYADKGFQRITLVNDELTTGFAGLAEKEVNANADLLRKSVEQNDGFDNLLLAFGKKTHELSLTDGDSLWLENLLNATGSETLLGQSLLKITVPDGAKATLVISSESNENTKALLNQLITLNLGSQAELDFVLIQNLNLVSDSVQRLEFSCAEQSKLNFLNISKGAKLARVEASISTLGESCEINANAIVVALDGQHHDVRMEMNHNFPEGFSDQLFKSILSNSSRAVFNGKIFIAPQAQKIDSNLLNNNLVLDEKSEVDTKPELDIYADDVKATHGATIGQLNEEELFYLESRGIPKAVASKLMAEGFVSEPIFRMGGQSLVDLLHRMFKESSWLSNLEIS